MAETIDRANRKHVCPNCGQFQHALQALSGETVYDCFHDCAARGFVPAPKPRGWKVRVDDWLLIYRLADGHSSIRNTELWPEWGLIGTEREPKSEAYRLRRKRDVLRRGIAIGPAPHDPGWCEVCALALEDESEYDPRCDGGREIPCVACQGAATYLGRLGRLDHFRCRQCGADFSREV